eukprot:s514_g8.t1
MGRSMMMDENPEEEAELLESEDTRGRSLSSPVISVFFPWSRYWKYASGLVLVVLAYAGRESLHWSWEGLEVPGPQKVRNGSPLPQQKYSGLNGATAPMPKMPDTATEHNGIEWPEMRPGYHQILHGAETMTFMIIGDWGGMDGAVVPPNGGLRMVQYNGGMEVGPHVFAHRPSGCTDGEMSICFNARGGNGCKPNCGYNDSVDYEPGLLVATQMKKRAATSKPKFILNVGDNFYWGGIPLQCGASPIAGVNFPDKGFDMDILLLDSNSEDAVPSTVLQNTNLCSPVYFAKLWQEQVAWTEKKLNNSKARWQVIVTHFPCGHQAPWYQKLHAQFGLDLMVTGHTHVQLTSPVGGLMCVISGGGGGIMSEAPSHGDDSNSYGFYEATVDRDHMQLELINFAGRSLGKWRLHWQKDAPTHHEVVAEKPMTVPKRHQRAERPKDAKDTLKGTVAKKPEQKACGFWCQLLSCTVRLVATGVKKQDRHALLSQHNIDFSDCVEKSDLQERWRSYRMQNEVPGRQRATPSTAPRAEAQSSPPAKPSAQVTSRDREAQEEVLRILPLRREAFRTTTEWAFTVLGASREPGSVQRSYRNLMRKLHPDKVTITDGVEKTTALIREAKDMCEKSFSKIVCPGAPRGLRYEVVDREMGHRRYRLRWLAPEGCAVAPVSRYGIVWDVRPHSSCGIQPRARASGDILLHPIRSFCQRNMPYVISCSINPWMRAQDLAMAPRHGFRVLVAGLLFGASVYRQTFSIAPAQRMQPSVKLQDWEVEVSEEEGGRGLTVATRQRCAAALQRTGFAVLRGASLFAEEELQVAQRTATAELRRVQKATEELGLLQRAPWIPGTYSIEKLFEFQEALCYSQGRLDMPKFLDAAPLKSSRWCGHPDLHGITRLVYSTASSQQTVLGALWNFPGSGPPVWHRDGLEQRLLVAVTACAEYPEEVGFIHGQPQTHSSGARKRSPGPKPPDPSLGELDVALPLKRGETLLFFYSTKHAATPNLSDLERCLIYSVYGPVGVHDQQNHKGFLPSIFNITAEEARDLDQFYERQGYLISNQGNEGSQAPIWAPLAGLLVASLMACLVLR